MGNLAQYTPQESPVVTAIYEWHKKMGDSEPERGYLGASIIGHECDRYLWYTFRGCVKRNFDGRLYRLFETGDLEEARFVKELRAIGCEVHDRDEKGEQFAVSAIGGHFSGHMDGCARGIPGAEKSWHVLEFKTHNAKSFDKLKADGVQKSKPMHYAQMQVYMGIGGMERALYLAACKNTDELYAERVRFSASDCHHLLQRAERIIKAQAPPERVAGRNDDFRCRFCDAYPLCWGTGEIAVPLPRKTCKTCCHATPLTKTEGGIWSCVHWFEDVKEFMGGCHRHLLLPGLISFAAPVDAGDDWIEFENHGDKARWRHGDGAGETWKTEDLISGRGPLDGPKAPEPCPLDDPPGTPPRTIPQRYPWGDSELLWHGAPGEIESTLESMGLKGLLDTEPTRIENTDKYRACDYADAGIAVVIYLDDNSAAIWRGKE